MVGRRCVGSRVTCWRGASSKCEGFRYACATATRWLAREVIGKDVFVSRGGTGDRDVLYTWCGTESMSTKIQYSVNKVTAKLSRGFDDWCYLGWKRDAGWQHGGAGLPTWKKVGLALSTGGRAGRREAGEVG